MKVFLLRHGTAEDGADDFARRLVEKGRAQARQVAELLARMGARPDRILTSPLVRARETAEELVRRLGGRPAEIVVEDRLAPGHPLAAMAAALVEVEARAVLAVGHEPSLSRLAGYLTGAEGLRLDLRKGGLVELELPPGSSAPRGVLLGLIRPGHLRSS
jgi:phosphohistidine phosphatase